MARKPLTAALFGLAGTKERKPALAPKKVMGRPGFSVFGGRLKSKETNAKVTGKVKWRTYADISTNVSIVAAGLRSFTNLIQRTEWTVEPARDRGQNEDPSDAAKEAAEFLEEILHGMDTPWNKVMTKASTFKFYGFSISEWQAMQRDDGRIGLLDIMPRPQHTIERWDIDYEGGGNVLGVWQQPPQTGEYLYLPRKKLLYVVDDILTDSPDGMGLLRHVVEPAEKLKEYMRNEALGIQRDMRGIPIGRAPLTALDEMVASGEITADERTQQLQYMDDLVQMQAKSEDTGVVVDSITYQNKTDAGETFTSVPKWGLELVTGGGNGVGIRETGMAIDRLNREMARVLGVEHLMLGDGSGGNRALSEDKTRNFFLQMEGTLQDLSQAVEKDIVDMIWALNGMPEELKPTMAYEAVQFKDVSQITAALREMATAGAVLSPDDPAIDEVRTLLGLSGQPDQDPLAQALNLGETDLADDPVEDDDEADEEMDRGED